MITQCNFGDGDIDIKGYRSIYEQLVMAVWCASTVTLIGRMQGVWHCANQTRGANSI